MSGNELDRPLLDPSMNASIKPKLRVRIRASSIMERENIERSDAAKKLCWAIFLATIFMVGEFIGGYFAYSLAVMTDAAHLLSDVAGFALSLSALWLSKSPATVKLTYGLLRAEVLGALTSILLIWCLTVFLCYEAVQRTITIVQNDHGIDIDGKLMVIIGSGGLFINVLLMKILGGHGHSHYGSGHSHSHGNDDEEVNHQENSSHDIEHGKTRLKSEEVSHQGHSHSHSKKEQDHGHSHSHSHSHSHTENKKNTNEFANPTSGEDEDCSSSSDEQGEGQQQQHGHSHQANNNHGHSHEGNHGHSHEGNHGHSHDNKKQHNHGHSHSNSSGGEEKSTNEQQEQHGHSHQSGVGGGHSHSHSEKKVSPNTSVQENKKDDHGHSHQGKPHGHGHGHEHENDQHHGHHHPRENINMRAAYIHALGDLIQNVGVIISGGLIWWQANNNNNKLWQLADPACTFFFSIVVLQTSIHVFKSTILILMEGIPSSVDYNGIKQSLESINGVDSVHDLHIWSLTSGKAALTAHIRSNDQDSHEILMEAQRRLKPRNITHITIQVERTTSSIECHCDSQHFGEMGDSCHELSELSN